MGNKHKRDSLGGSSMVHINPRMGDSPLTGGGCQPITSTSSENIPRLDSLCIHENDKCENFDGAEKKKRVSRIVGGGLRQFSLIVCKKVEAKGRTTYGEVADEIIAEFMAPDNNTGSLTAFDEKNIRRRVYDAFNVLMAIDVIARDKKEIRWIGLPNIKNEVEELQEEHANLLARIQKKVNYLQDLEEHFVGLKNLMLHNQQMHKSENVPTNGVALPFILVQTRPQATVEIEISEDMRLVHFDFNGTPFALHDDGHVLKEMRHCQAAAPRPVTRSSDGLASMTSHGNKTLGAATSFSWNAETIGTR